MFSDNRIENVAFIAVYIIDRTYDSTVHLVSSVTKR
jgi:hypothetical protein